MNKNKVIIRKPIVRYVRNKYKKYQFQTSIYDFLIKEATTTIDTLLDKAIERIKAENKLRRLNHIPELKRVMDYHMEELL